MLNVFKRTLSLEGLTAEEKETIGGILCVHIRPDAYAVQVLANGAVKFHYVRPTAREKALSRIVSNTQESIINTNYRWHKRKVNSKGALVKKNGGFYKNKQANVL